MAKRHIGAWLPDHRPPPTRARRTSCALTWPWRCSPGSPAWWRVMRAVGRL